MGLPTPLAESQTSHRERTGQVRALDAFHERAYHLMTARRALVAITVCHEDARLRDRHGLHSHGRSLPQANRLVAAGVPVVTEFWQNDCLTDVSGCGNTHSRSCLLLGVDPAIELDDPLGRPSRLCLGTPLAEVLG
ncbi:MAG: hypothetical protein P4L84_18375 [Isosphaeraceae bacterium]|nr:hypothetical protein [Isosphaeraceae bacterium]